MDAVLVTSADKHHFAMDYFLWVEGRREDLFVVDDALITHPWYRDQQRKRYPQAETVWAADTIIALLESNVGKRRVFASLEPRALPLSFAAVWHDPVWEIIAVPVGK